MRKTHGSIGILAITFILAGCGEVPDQLGPDMESQRTTRVEGGRAVVQSVTGSGHLTVPAGYLRTFAFTARRHGAKSISGQWERVNGVDGNASGVKAHGVVTCFRVVGNYVWIGGYATSGNFTEPGANEVAWRVADHQQGHNAPADEISLQLVAAPTGYAAAFCAAAEENLALHPIEAGNITIHPNP